MIARLPAVTVGMQERIRWCVICDRCEQCSLGTHIDPGEAAELARREGFVAAGGRDGGPKIWLCKSCKR